LARRMSAGAAGNRLRSEVVIVPRGWNFDKGMKAFDVPVRPHPKGGPTSPRRRQAGTIHPVGNRCRIGVFYDGTWFSYVSDFYATTHRRAARITLGGLHDSLRWYVHCATGIDPDECEVVEAHYVRGRSATPSTVFDTVLSNAGVTRHDVELHGGKEKGVDIYLALEVWERATATPLECVALITGDADFTPLVTRLVNRGVRVIVPVIDTGDRGGPALHTAAQLREATADAPTFDELFAPSDLDDYPLRFPFVRSAGITRTPSTTPDRRWQGIVTGWRPGQTHGFITDSAGRSWFASRDELPDGYEELPINTPVSFTGSPNPAPGKKYPQAYSILIH
jgi:NYN domain